MKRKTAKEVLADSFREIAEKKTIDKITIRDITENCDYSSATFYRYFKDKYDLIAWDYAQFLETIVGRTDAADFRWRQALTDWARCLWEERKYFVNLFLHTNGHDSFLQNMTDLHHQYLRREILSVSGGTKLDQKTEMYVHGFCLAMTSLIYEWVQENFTVSAEELAEVCENLLPTPLLCIFKKEKEFS